jgi:hypothetical protein
MARITVEELFETAKSGQRKMTASERRRVLLYLDEIGEKGLTVFELARIFRVSEQQIRDDKRRIIQHYVGGLTPEFAMLFVAKHFKDTEDLISTARRGLDQNDPGSTLERFYIETLSKLYRDRWGALQEVGIVRKELANMNADEEKWVATVAPDGECGVHKDETKTVKSDKPE